MKTFMPITLLWVFAVLQSCKKESDPVQPIVPAYECGDSLMENPVYANDMLHAKLDDKVQTAVLNGISGQTRSDYSLKIHLGWDTVIGGIRCTINLDISRTHEFGESLSADEIYETVQPGSYPYLDYSIENGPERTVNFFVTAQDSSTNQMIYQYASTNHANYSSTFEITDRSPSFTEYGEPFTRIQGVFCCKAGTTLAGSLPAVRTLQGNFDGKVLLRQIR